MEIPGFNKQGLSDLDIEIKIRSGQSDYKNLENLSQAIVASVRKYLDLEVELMEVNSSLIQDPKRILVTISRKLRLE